MYMAAYNNIYIYLVATSEKERSHAYVIDIILCGQAFWRVDPAVLIVMLRCQSVCYLLQYDEERRFWRVFEIKLMGPLCLTIKLALL